MNNLHDIQLDHDYEEQFREPTKNELLEEIQDLKQKYYEAVADYEYEKSKNQGVIEYIENNWISYDDSKLYQDKDTELIIRIKDIYELYEILKGEKDGR